LKLPHGETLSDIAFNFKLRRYTTGGHSYGAFMSANLLAHAPDLFACAVAVGPDG
jgi:pimeloyl-ACP methyl ester carboxylesterase